MSILYYINKSYAKKIKNKNENNSHQIIQNSLKIKSYISQIRYFDSFINIHRNNYTLPQISRYRFAHSRMNDGHDILT